MLPYKGLENNLILRDFLAVDRTRLANERVLLAYIRTCLGALAAGAGLVKFVNDWMYNATGYVLIALSPVLLGIGIWRFFAMNRKLNRLDDAAEPAGESEPAGPGT